MIQKEKKNDYRKVGGEKGEILDWREKVIKKKKKVKWREKLTNIFLVCFFIYLTREWTFGMGGTACGWDIKLRKLKAEGYLGFILKHLFSLKQTDTYAISLHKFLWFAINTMAFQ